MTVPITTTTGWLRAIRAVITVQTVVAFLAAVAAGLLLTVRAGHALHSATAYALWSVAVIHVVVATLCWRPGRGSGWLLLIAVAFLAGVSLQVVLGIAHLTALHVPLGVLLIAGTVLEAAWIWMPHPVGQRAASVLLGDVEHSSARRTHEEAPHAP